MALVSPRSHRATVLSFMLGALAFVSPALAGEADELIAKVEAKYAEVKSLKADFTQTARSEVYGDEVSKGELVVARPAKMRWAFGTEKLFVADGTKMWIYTSADKQVIEYDDIGQSQTSTESLFTSLDKLTELFDVTVLGSSDEGHSLSLKPHEEAQFKVVELYLDGALLVQKVKITDAFDNLTELEFKNVTLNVETSDAMFTFKVPEDVSVIKAN